MEFKKPERQSSKLSLKLFGSVYEVYLLGLSTVIGGQVVMWHVGLKSGFYEFLIVTVTIALGYGCLTLCVAELTSVLPFSGGTYGLCRVTLGSYMGYMIGCFEFLQSLFYVATIVSIFGSMLTTLFNTSTKFEPLWWLLFYITTLTIQIRGNSVISKIVSSFAVLVVCLVVVFDVGTTSTMDFPRHALTEDLQRTTAGQIKDFLHHLPYACWFFLGVENLPLLCGDTILAINRVPRAMLWVYVSAVISAFALLFACASHAPGVLVISNFSVFSPLVYGFSDSFGISVRWAVLLVLPATWSAGFGFLHSLGRQSSAMAKSGLFPRLFSVAYHYDPNDLDAQVPVAALVSGAVLGYIVLLMLWFTFGDRLMMRYLLANVCLLASVVVYLSIFASFIVFRRKYYTLDKGRPFYNPIGKYKCAAFGLLVFSLAAIGLCGFQNDMHVALIVLSAYAAVMTVYYYAVSQKRQHFSAEEQAALLVAYIINTNTKGKKKLTRSASFKKEQSFRNQLIKSASFHSLHRGSLTGRESPERSLRSLPNSPGRIFSHGAQSVFSTSADSDKSSSVHMMSSRNDSLATVKLSGLNSIKELPANEGTDGQKRFILREEAILSESRLTCHSNNNLDQEKEINKDPPPLICLTAESTATANHVLFSLVGAGSREDSIATSKNHSLQNSKISSPTNVQQQSIAKEKMFDGHVAIPKEEPLMTSDNIGDSVRTNVTGSSNKVVLDPLDGLLRGFSSSVLPFANIHDSACTVDLIHPSHSPSHASSQKASQSASRREPDAAFPAEVLEVEVDGLVSCVTVMRETVLLDAEEDEEEKSTDLLLRTQSKSPTNGGNTINKSDNNATNGKHAVELVREDSITGRSKQTSITITSGEFLRSLFYGAVDGSIKSNNSGGSGGGLLKSSLLAPRSSGQYSAPLVEGDEEDDLVVGESRNKARRRPSLSNDFFNSLQPSTQSSRFRSSTKASGGGGIAFGLKSSFSAAKGSFSILSSTDISKILPVMNYDDLLQSSQTNDNDDYCDAHTSDVVSRMIADNMGVAYFDSLLVDDLEDGPDETEQQQQQQGEKGEEGESQSVDNRHILTTQSKQMGRQSSDTQMGFTLLEVESNSALDRHVSSRIQSLAQTYFLQQQTRQLQYAVGVSGKSSKR